MGVNIFILINNCYRMLLLTSLLATGQINISFQFLCSLTKMTLRNSCFETEKYKSNKYCYGNCPLKKKVFQRIYAKRLSNFLDNVGKW